MSARITRAIVLSRSERQLLGRRRGLMKRRGVMNKLAPVNRLQAAMEAADADEIEALAGELAQAAVKAVLEQGEPEAIKAEADALVLQRQRDLDGALADAIEVVARHRARLSRKVCSRHDGQTVRQVFELLRGMLEGGAEGDASFS
jgi:hypothetical protein